MKKHLAARPCAWVPLVENDTVRLGFGEYVLDIAWIPIKLSKGSPCCLWMGSGISGALLVFTFKGNQKVGISTYYPHGLMVITVWGILALFSLKPGSTFLGFRDPS